MIKQTWYQLPDKDCERLTRFEMQSVRWIMAALNILMLIGGLRKSAFGNEEKIDVKGMKMPLISLLIIAVYELLFIKTNYFIATPLFLIALFTYLRQRNWKLMIAVIACYLVAVYLVFVLLLKVKLL